MKISKKALAEAQRAVSMDGRYWYSARNLYYELVRRDAVPPPAGHPKEELADFRAALPKMEGLVDAEAARKAVPKTNMDVFDYAVRRVLVFDRVDTFLVFAKNGFHRKIEIALVVWPDFPAHVWSKLITQVAGELRTAFYTVHDASLRGRNLMRRVKKEIRSHGSRARFADVGITFGHAFHRGIPVRQRANVKKVTEPVSEHERLLALTGNYAHLEELVPIDMMRWTYSRIARGPDDPGFG